MKQTLSAVAFANLGIQILSRIAALQAFAEKHCSPVLPEPLETILKMADTDNGRLILSAVLAIFSCGLKMMLHPMREVRELGCTLIMLLFALAYIALGITQPHGENTNCYITRPADPRVVKTDLAQKTNAASGVRAITK